MTDTSDLVRRLREQKDWLWSYDSVGRGYKHKFPTKLEIEAADRLEALEAQNKRLREALEEIADGFSDPDIRDIARAALKETEG